MHTVKGISLDRRLLNLTRLYFLFVTENLIAVFSFLTSSRAQSHHYSEPESESTYVLDSRTHIFRLTPSLLFSNVISLSLSLCLSLETLPWFFHMPSPHVRSVFTSCYSITCLSTWRKLQPPKFVHHLIRVNY